MGRGLPRVRAYQQVRAYEPVLRWADIETLHELRIAAKWLRYSLEFVREALGPESAPLIARVTALQDHLGLMHDADVAASMARAFLVAHAGDLSTQESAAIGRYLVSCEREVTRLRRSIAVPWRGVAGIGFRRGLGRVLAAPQPLPLRPPSRGPGPTAGRARLGRHVPGPGWRPPGCPPRTPASSPRRSAAGSRRR